MKMRTVFLLFAFMVMLPFTSNGQVGGLLRNKLSKVVNAGTRTVDKEIDNKIDTAVQKNADSTKSKAATRTENSIRKEGQPSESADQDSQGGGGFGRLFENKIDLNYKENYDFTSRIYMVTETYDKKDVIKMDFFLFYSASNPVVGVETKTISDEKGETTPVTAVMVMDGENKSFIVLSEINGMKMGIISAIPDENAEPADGKAKKKTTPPIYTKTGNTKEIAGYRCDEYSYVDAEEKTTGKVWFTKDINLRIDSRAWKNSGMSSYYGNPDFSDGIILATETYDDKGRLTMKSETREIDKNYPHSISVAGYSLRQVNIGQRAKK